MAMCSRKGTHSVGCGLVAGGQTSLTWLQEPLLCAPGVWALERGHLQCASGLLATENREAALSRRKGVRGLYRVVLSYRALSWALSPTSQVFLGKLSCLWPSGLLTETREGCKLQEGTAHFCFVWHCVPGT